MQPSDVVDAGFVSLRHSLVLETNLWPEGMTPQDLCPCPNCGATIALRARLCPSCGAYLPQASTDRESSAMEDLLSIAYFLGIAVIGFLITALGVAISP